MITDAILQGIDLVMVLVIPIHIRPGHTVDTIAKNANALHVIKRESTSRSNRDDRAQPRHNNNTQYRNARSISASFIRSDLMKDWEPKISDCYLITGGQIKRLRDEQDPQKRKDIVSPMVYQKYHTELGDNNDKFDEQKKQKKLFDVI